MRKILLFSISLLSVISLKAQDLHKNIGSTILEKVKTEKLVVGGYGEVHYNQQIKSDTRYNGKMDVHRMVMFFGYQFNDKTSFVTELEFEHVKEVYVEQAFINYNLAPSTSLRAGLMLIPMGITNEYHEPTSFNGVERPSVDKYIIPSTWREIGFGVNGRLDDSSIKYQFYVMNGFNGISDGKSILRGKDGLRKGRQKGAESVFTSPSLTGKVEYYGIKGLNVGVAGYFGKTQSALFNGLDKDDKLSEDEAEKSRIGVAMLGLDARYTNKAFQAKAQYVHTYLSNVKDYNSFADGADLGTQMQGYYLEAGYDLLHGKKQALVPFVRYENYNTHHKVVSGTVANKSYDREDVVLGLSYFLAKGAVVKADYQISMAGQSDTKRFINCGIGIWF